MKLADWIFQNLMTPSTLRRRLGITNRSTVHRWLHGERIAKPEYMVRIKDLTNGEVTLRDFLDPTPPECAVVVTLANGKTKWILPWSHTSEEELDSPHNPHSHHDEVSLPVRRALATLGRRAIEQLGGMYRVDGRITDTSGLIKKANQTLHNENREQIAFPGIQKIGGDND